MPVKRRGGRTPAPTGATIEAPRPVVDPAPCLGCSDQVGRPVPVEPVAGLTAAPADVLVPAPDALGAGIDGHLVVLEPATGRGVLLNASAALILTAFDGRLTLAQVVDQLAGETGMDAELIRSDVRGTVDRLLAQGFLTIAGRAADEAEPIPPAPEADPQRWRPTIERLLAGAPWAFDSGPRRVAATAAAVRTDDAEIGERLRELLSALPAPGVAGPADHLLSIVSRGPGGPYRLVLDGRVVSRVATRDAAVVHALHHLDELAVAGSAGALLFHAGAVERDGRVVVVLGVSGKGKSTLTAALVRAGYRYLSDEIVAVDTASGEVWPYPKALDLHTESLGLLGLGTGAASLQLPGSKAKVLPDRIGEVGPVGGRPALLVFLAETLVPPAATGAVPVEAVPPAEALVAILPVTFERTVDGPGHFQALAALCEATPAIRIGRAPLDATIAEIEAALAVAG